jgi:hypothetical protein
MSHQATNWALQQRGLKPTTKIVLWHLCDRFNPDFGCFPSQERLAYDCEISRSTLNDHIARLEKTGLLRRVPRIHPVTKRQMPTRYILGFEPGFAPDTPDPCPETGHGGGDSTTAPDMPAMEADDLPIAPDPCLNSGHGLSPGPVSDLAADPCPEIGQSRVRNPDTNPVREPLRETVKEEQGARAREADLDLIFAELLKALGFDPEGPLPAWWQGWPPRTHVLRWMDDLGLTGDQIIAVAEDTRRTHPEPPDGPKALDRAMQRAAHRAAQANHPGANDPGAKRRSKRQGAPRPSEDKMAAFYAEIVNSDRYLPPTMLSAAMCQAMLDRGLVAPERLRERGVR